MSAVPSHLPSQDLFGGSIARNMSVNLVGSTGHAKAYLKTVVLTQIPDTSLSVETAAAGAALPASGQSGSHLCLPLLPIPQRSLLACGRVLIA